MTNLILSNINKKQIENLYEVENHKNSFNVLIFSPDFILKYYVIVYIALDSKGLWGNFIARDE